MRLSAPNLTSSANGLESCREHRTGAHREHAREYVLTRGLCGLTRSLRGRILQIAGSSSRSETCKPRDAPPSGSQGGPGLQWPTLKRTVPVNFTKAEVHMISEHDMFRDCSSFVPPSPYLPRDARPARTARFSSDI